jgi:hypothetical protein
MQQCNHCHYFVPDEHLSCPKCGMPLGHAPATMSVYNGANTPGSNRKQLIIGGVVVALLLLTTAVVVHGGGKSKTFVDSPDLAQVTNDGWRPFYAPEGFSASFPGKPDRSVEQLPTYGQEQISYTVTQGDFTFGVIVIPAPAYAAPQDAGAKLEAWFHPILEGQGATFEGASRLTTPQGDQAYDVVVVLNGARKWMRYLTWNGSVLIASAQMPATEQPTTEQSASYKRLRDSLHQ